MTDAIRLRSVITGKFIWLLLSLLAVLAIAPLFEDRFVARLLQDALLTAVYIAGVVANRQRRRVFRAAILIALVAVPLTWAPLMVETVEVSVARHLVGVVFLVMTAVMILISVLKDHLATHDAVLGAICVYLLLGLTWALAYSAVDYVDPAAFSMRERQESGRSATANAAEGWSQMIYFSFVTMSTLGYGDIVPRTPVAQTLTWMQAVTGQFYLAVLVARLIGLLPPRPAQQEE